MRLVDWTEFKTLPVGTIYQEYAQGSLDPLMILGEINPSGRDFTGADLLPNVCMPHVFDDVGLKHLGIDQDEGVEVIHMPSGFGRDALYEFKGRRWLIWEEADRARLAAWLLDPEKALREQNDEAHAFVIVRGE